MKGRGGVEERVLYLSLVTTPFTSRMTRSAYRRDFFSHYSSRDIVPSFPFVLVALLRVESDGSVCT